MAEHSGEMILATEKIFISEYPTPPINRHNPTEEKKEKHLGQQDRKSADNIYNKVSREEQTNRKKIYMCVSQSVGENRGKKR